MIEIPKIEAYLWNSNIGTKKYGMNVIRNCFLCLYTLNAVVRSESLYKADMADLCDFKFLQSREVAHYHIIVNRIGMGKVVKETAYFGKVMQHKGILRCSIGAMRLTFLGIFHVLQEYLIMYFINNESWINKKILSSPIGKYHDACAYYITEYFVILQYF